MSPNQRSTKSKRGICQVCNQTESKYTCPRLNCGILYCSVNCFKEHKKTECAERPGPPKAGNINVSVSEGPESMGTRPSSSGIASIDLTTPSIGSSTHSASASTGTEHLSESNRKRKLEQEDESEGREPLQPEPKPQNERKEEEEERLEGAKPKASPLRKLSSLKWPYIPDSATTEYPDPLNRDDPKPLTMPQYEAIARSPEIRQFLTTNPSLRSILKLIDAQRGNERSKTLERLLGVSPSPSSTSSTSAFSTGGSDPRMQRKGDEMYKGEFQLNAPSALVSGVSASSSSLPLQSGTKSQAPHNPIVLQLPHSTDNSKESGGTKGQNANNENENRNGKETILMNEEDVKAFKEFMEAIERAIRVGKGRKEGLLGLDWEEEDGIA